MLLVTRLCGPNEVASKAGNPQPTVAKSWIQQGFGARGPALMDLSSKCFLLPVQPAQLLLLPELESAAASAPVLSPCLAPTVPHYLGEALCHQNGSEASCLLRPDKMVLLAGYSPQAIYC